MPRTKTPPLPIGTRVDIDIAQGMSASQGVIVAAEYDDGWLYRIDVTGGDDCEAHRNAAGELWVCGFEAKPSGAAAAAKHPGPMPHTIDIVDDLMVVLDEDGNGGDCHELRGLCKAKRQLRRWQDEYTFDYAEALRAVSAFFANQ